MWPTQRPKGCSGFLWWSCWVAETYKNPEDWRQNTGAVRQEVVVNGCHCESAGLCYQGWHCQLSLWESLTIGCCFLLSIQASGPCEEIKFLSQLWNPGFILAEIRAPSQACVSSFVLFWRLWLFPALCPASFCSGPPSYCWIFVPSVTFTDVILRLHCVHDCVSAPY